MSDIDVSVVVPCYNGERYLDQCLSSIEANDKAQIEILAVNDGSRDASLQIMETHAAKDLRVRVIDKANSGYGASVNRGFDEARGTYVTIVECDDFVKPHFYDRLVEYARTFMDSPQIVKTPYVRVVQPDTDRERRLHCKCYGLVKQLDRTFTLSEQPLLIHYHPSIWSALYRRDFLQGCGIRMHEVPGAGWVDNPFLLETMFQAQRIAYLEEEFYCYREDAPGSSSVLKNADTVIDRWNDMQDIVERLGIVDDAILDTHTWHAFAFVEPFANASLDKGSRLYGRVHDMFARLDPAHVFTNRFVSNASKSFYAQVMGVAEPSWDRLGHTRQMAFEALHGLKTNGIGFVGAYADAFFAAHRKDVVKSSDAQGAKGL